jgi:spermidine synthase
MVGALFFLSGACALGYEVVWARTLALTLGGSAAANASVLACFLGGLALGGVLLGPAADRAEKPLKLFALLELGVALCGYAAPWALRAPAGLALVALAATLMGGTLPTLARAVDAARGLERGVALLGAFNNAGGAAGALLAGFVLLPALGLTGASHFLAGLGVFIAAAAAALAVPSAGPAAPRTDAESDPVPTGLVLAAVFVTGIVTLTAEAAWVRLLAVVLGASTYSFTVMVVGFVGGMGLGSWAVAALRPKGVPAARLYAWAQLGAGLSVLAAWPLYERLPWLFWRLNTSVPRTPDAYPWFEAGKLAFCFMLTLPPTFFLGAAFPLAARTAAARWGRVGAGVGAAAALAALGNVAGALLGGLVLLPALGVQSLLTAAAGARRALGAALCLADSGLGWRLRGAPAALAAAALAAHLVWGGSWDRLILAVGTHRYEGVTGLSFGDYLSALREKRTVLFQRDDAEASVSVLEMPEEKLRALMINGKADASTGVDMGTQVLLGQLPFALVPGAKKALLVGLGSGVTAGTALRWPLERLDVAEISPAVVEAGRFFLAQSGDPLSDPRLRLHVGDGRALLRRSEGGYDAVVSEPSNPWIAGVGNLFTSEYFRLARSKLAPGGVMVQWFHLYETEDALVRSIVGTFCDVFDDASLWRTNGGDAFLVGFNGRRAPDFAAMERGLAGPPAAAMGRLGLDGTAALLSLQTAADAGTRGFGYEARRNTDRNPFLEYAAPRGRFLRSNAEGLKRLDESVGPWKGDLLLSRYLAWRKRALSESETRSILGYSRTIRGDWRLALTQEWAAAKPGAAEPRVWEARLRLEREEPEEALKTLASIRSPADAPRWTLQADAFEMLDRLPEARAALAKAARASKGAAAAELWLRSALLAMDLNDAQGAADSLAAALAADPEHAQARSLLDHLVDAYSR